jgi:DNA polymerase elongation subunit (family B)
VFESKKMMVGFVLNHLHKQNMVFPVYRPTAKEEYPGAFVYSVPGFYKIEVSYDYRSLYPSIMMTFNISPETKVIKPIDYVLTEEEKKVLIRSPWTHNGQYQVFYRKDVEGIVPQVTRKLFNGRAELKIKKKQAEKDGNEELMNIYDMMQKVYKVLGNSLYGLLGTPFFAFYDIDNAASITGYGQRLIKYTCKHLAEYINNDLSKDQRFINTFGYSPKINPDYCGEIFWNEANVDFDDVEKATEWGYDITGDILQRRMSNGDTDSFYAKFDDIYEEFSKNQGKKVQVVVYDGHQIIHKDDFDAGNEAAYKKQFALMSHTYCPDVYDKKSNREPQEIKGSKYKFSKLQIMYKDGMISNKRYRVILNRYRLTDFCRMLDASILEEKLDDYMEGYANLWGYRTNELFLKREKCIYKTIVTAKKKYICVAESN